ncbi:cyclic nucleotide-binding domain-containing protein [Aquincola sp. S2]|uniref:Cyclic nucleotide-binding domain-containing protein n=1 Tax=Pseudaquabacterium terrae TaxID=2732868 RepID=A0ABX2EQG3_9BURK|nr:cyclic nucleotide-binding domain-containing protein [Aquabacterium terrae]NRF70950.1 cyclic nucleotide-binding domain-containing protein [Aquabacterium terrae]
MHTVRIELLQQMPIFGAIREDALAYLLEPAPSVRVSAGSYFFREGEPAQSMYVLESGRVSIIKNWGGRELLLRELGPGDCIGEMALLDLFPRSATVRAVLDCTAIELTPAHMMRLYEKDLEQFALIQMNIAREMSRRLRVTDELLFRARMGELPSSAANPEFDTVSLRIQRPPAPA